MTVQVAQIQQADHPPGTRFLVYAPAQMPMVVRAMAAQAAPLLAGQGKVAVIGVLRRGAPLADMLARVLQDEFKLSVPLRLDLKVKRYADDLTLLHPETQLTESAGQAELDLKGYTLLVVDDVLYTGSSLLRVIDWLNARSPKAIHTAVLFIAIWLSYRFVPMPWGCTCRWRRPMWSNAMCPLMSRFFRLSC